MDHERVMNAVTERMLGREVPDDILCEALTHVSACPECLRQLGVTARLLHVMESFKSLLDEPVFCETIEARLPELVDLGKAADSLYPLEMWHVTQCGDCGRQYQELAELTRQSTAGELGELPAPAVTREEGTSPSWDLRGRVRRLKEHVGVVVGSAGLRIAQVADGISAWVLPPQVPEGAMVGLHHLLESSGNQQQNRIPGWSIRIPDATESLELQLELRWGPRGRIHGRALLLETKGTKALPVREIAVQVKTGRWHVLARNRSTFVLSLSAAEQLLRIASQESTWEVPLRIQRERPPGDGRA